MWSVFVFSFLGCKGGVELISEDGQRTVQSSSIRTPRQNHIGILAVAVLAEELKSEEE